MKFDRIINTHMVAAQQGMRSGVSMFLLGIGISQLWRFPVRRYVPRTVTGTI